MEFRNCARCGKAFVYVSRPVCENCILQEEEEFKIIKDFIEKNPDSNLVQVAEATDIPADRLMEYLREGRLELQGLGKELLACERCGMPIHSGRYCESCIVELNSSVNNLFNQRQENKKLGATGKMHTYNRDKRR